MRELVRHYGDSVRCWRLFDAHILILLYTDNGTKRTVHIASIVVCYDKVTSILAQPEKSCVDIMVAYNLTG